MRVYGAVVMNPQSPRVLLAGLVLSVQLVLALGMLFSARPAPYGWQMYSAVPYNPVAWAVTDGRAEAINVESALVHGRAEIDRVALLRSHGCDWTGADTIRIQLQDQSVDEMACP